MLGFVLLFLGVLILEICVYSLGRMVKEQEVNKKGKQLAINFLHKLLVPNHRCFKDQCPFYEKDAEDQCTLRPFLNSLKEKHDE